MKKAVFPENVVEGLTRWQANARKNIALKNINTSSRPSLDAPTLDTSPSFSLHPSYSVEFGQPSSEEYKLDVEIKGEESESISRENLLRK